MVTAAPRSFCNASRVVPSRCQFPAFSPPLISEVRESPIKKYLLRPDRMSVLLPCQAAAAALPCSQGGLLDFSKTVIEKFLLRLLAARLLGDKYTGEKGRQSAFFKSFILGLRHPVCGCVKPVLPAQIPAQF